MTYSFVVRRHLAAVSSLRWVLIAIFISVSFLAKSTAQVFTTSADIGSVGATGSSSYSSGTYTINGAGGGIGGTADAFRYTSKTQSGDCQIVARVSSVQNTNAAAKAGIMIRESTAVGARHATLAVTPGSGVVFLSRGSTNGSTTTTTVNGRVAPVWLKLIRVGTTFSAYISQDGVAWERVQSATVAMGASATSGLAVSSNVSGTLCQGVITDASATAATITDTQFPVAPTGVTATSKSDVTTVLTWSPATDDIGIASYDIYRNAAKIGSVTGTIQRYVDLTVSPSTVYNYTVRAIDAAAKASPDSSTVVVASDANSLLAPWAHKDIGAIGVAGTALSGVGITVKGSGADIGGTTDAFHFAYQTINGSGEIIAKLNSMTNTGAGAKAGVMIRESTNPDAPFAMMLVTPSSGASFIRRTTAGGSTTSTSGGAAITAPQWVRLVRTGNTFYAFRSTDGVSWTVIGNATITMTSSVMVGLAVTSQSMASLCDAAFQNGSASGDSDADGLPDQWEMQYFGNLSQGAGTDSDGEGTTNQQELAAGTNPNDYYNGSLPTLSIVSGNNQSTGASTQFANPLIVKAVRGGSNLNNAPLTFTVVSGGSLLSATSGGAGTSAVNMRTASNGQTSAFCQAPVSDDATHTIQVTATSGAQSTSVSFTLFSDSLIRSGLQIWLRADRGVTKDSANRIATWADQSGNNRNATQSSTNVKPTLDANGLNGRPVVRFDGGDSFNLPNFLGSMTAATVFVVPRVAINASSENGLWRLGSSAAFEITNYPGYTDHTVIRESFGTSDSQYYPIPAQSLYDFHVYSVNATASSWQASINGKVLHWTDTNAVAFTTTPRLGRDINSFFKGDIAEFLIYNRGLTIAEEKSVRQYLNAKYAFVAGAPGTPLDLTATAITNQKVVVEWKGDTGNWETEHQIERRPSGGGSFAVVGTVADTNAFVDTSVIAGSYVYRVSAVRNGLTSVHSNEASVTVAPTVVAPTQTGLAAWFRADVGVTTDGSRSVSKWADLSGNTNDATQAGPALQPKWYQDSNTGQPMLEFGTTKLMESRFSVGNETGEIFAVLKVGDIFQEVLGGYFGGPFRFGFGFPAYPNVDQYSVWSNPLGIQESFGWGGIFYPRNRLDKTHIYHVRSDPTSWQAGMNGVNVFESPADADFIAGHLNIGERFPGTISELLIYTQTLTPTERGQVENYLNGRYGIVSDLPDPPTIRTFAVSPEQVYLCLDGSIDADVSYIVERKPVAGAYAVVGTIHAANGYLDQGLTGGTSYTYRVKARSLAGESSYSTEAAVSTPGAGTILPAADATAWFRGDGGVAKDGDNAVRLWVNQGSDAKVPAKNGVGQKPILHEHSLADRSFLSFDGVDDALRMNGFSGGFENEEGEFFVVVRANFDSLERDNALWVLCDGSGFGTRYPAADGTIWESFGRSSPVSFSAGSVRLERFNIYNVSAKVGDWTARLNDTVVQQEEIPSVNFTGGAGDIGSIGSGFPNPVRYFGGDLAEIIVFPRVLSTAERTTVVGYLQKKFALTDEDGDGMPDWWELEQFGTLGRNGTGDFDNDGLNDLNEYLNGLRANVADTDSDGLNDGFEIAHGLDGLRSNAIADTDGDGIPDAEDADPGNPAVGRMTILISTPADNSTLP